MLLISDLLAGWKGRGKMTAGKHQTLVIESSIINVYMAKMENSAPFQVIILHLLLANIKLLTLANSSELAQPSSCDKEVMIIRN